MFTKGLERAQIERRVEIAGDPSLAQRARCGRRRRQGTLDVMVLQTLHAMGPQHGYGLARRIEQRSGGDVLLNQGTIYAALVRLQHRGWIAADWGTSEANRRAKFYAITKAGKKQLAEQKSYWARLSAVMGRVLAPAGGDAK